MGKLVDFARGPYGGLATHALFPKGPKAPLLPKPPSIGATMQPFSSLIGPSEGNMNGTFVTGNNNTPNISGGKKTLGG